MKKLIVEIEEKTHDRLKRDAFDRGRTMKELVTSLIDNYLKQCKRV